MASLSWCSRIARCMKWCDRRCGQSGLFLVPSFVTLRIFWIVRSAGSRCFSVFLTFYYCGNTVSPIISRLALLTFASVSLFPNEALIFPSSSIFPHSLRLRSLVPEMWVELLWRLKKLIPDGKEVQGSVENYSALWKYLQGHFNGSFGVSSEVWCNVGEVCVADGYQYTHPDGRKTGFVYSNCFPPGNTVSQC